MNAVEGCGDSAVTCGGANTGSSGGMSSSGGMTSGTGGTTTGGVRPIHRYSFDATGSGEVTDSIGLAHGTLVGAGFDNGSVTLTGETSDQYVDLPPHLLAGLRDTTLESWVTWQGGTPWQRVFDFGEDATGVEDSRSAQPRSYLFLALKPQPRAAFKKPPLASAEILVEAGFALPTGVSTHLAVVVDEQNQRLALYVNGREEAATKFTASLTDVYDVNGWLGRSLYRADAGFVGSFHEFRIYDRALSAEQILASYAAGADALP